MPKNNTPTTTVTTPDGLEVNLLAIEIEGGQTRFALFVGGDLVVRAPSIREGVVRKTAEGSPVWVLGPNSGALTKTNGKALGRRLESGALIRVAFTGKTAPARLARAVREDRSFLSAKVLKAAKESRMGLQEAIVAKREEAKVSKADAKAEKAAEKAALKAQEAMMALPPEVLAALASAILAGVADEA